LIGVIEGNEGFSKKEVNSKESDLPGAEMSAARQLPFENISSTPEPVIFW
jgi:hypothetical protein